MQIDLNNLVDVTAAMAAAAKADSCGGRLGSLQEQDDAAVTVKQYDALKAKNRVRIIKYVEANRAAMEGTARQMLSSRCSAEDAVQDTICKALTTSRQFVPANNADSEGGFRAWLYTILQNVCLDIRRTAARHIPTLSATALPDHVMEEAATDPAPDPCDEVIWRLGLDGRRSDIRLVFPTLRPNYQAVLTECVINEKRPEEVAALWGFSVGAIRSMLMAARDELRAKMYLVEDSANYEMFWSALEVKDAPPEIITSYNTQATGTSGKRKIQKHRTLDQLDMSG